MKKLLFITTFLLITVTYSQKNLELNQVLNVELTSEGVTIPDGKAWKIEGTWGNYYDPTSGYAFLTVNDETFPLRDRFNIYPLWFPAGTVFKKPAGSSSYDVKFLSVLEFNLVPITSSGGNSVGSTSSSNDGIPVSSLGEDFIDQDGNTQGTTIAAGLTWTTENASHTTYRDGTLIPQVTSFEEMQNATTGRWAYLLYDEAYASYGKLYNFYAIQGKHDDDESTPNKKFAPEGWHVPRTYEYVHLIETYDLDGGSFGTWSSSFSFSSADLANNFKSETEWLDGHNGYNTSGLNVKPYSLMPNNSAGEVSYFQGIGQYTVFWTSTQYSHQYAHEIQFGYDGQSESNYYSWHDHRLQISTQNFYQLLYVRLVKDSQ